MQEYISWIARNWLTVAAAAFLIAMMLLGHSRGFLKTGLSSLNLLVALAGAGFLLSPVMGIVRQGPTLRDYAVGYVVLILLLWIILRIVIRVADLFAKLPVLHGLNQIAGALLGIAYGLMVLWVMCTAFEALGGETAVSGARNMISDSRFLTWIFEHNPLKKYCQLSVEISRINLDNFKQLML